jgi:hypothetical protein
MKPPRGHLEDLVARIGADPCKAYAAIASRRSSSYLAARLLDPESILILNLTVREEHLGSLAPGRDSSSWLFIAEDGNGNYYFLDSRAKPTLVHFLDHDPPGIRPSGFSLAQFIDSRAVQTIEPMNRELTICRSDHPRRSILNPIRLEEWIEVAAQYSEINITGFWEAKNPFTGAIDRFATKGGAYITYGETRIFAQIWAGRVVFRKAFSEFVPFAGGLSKSLNANLFTPRVAIDA